MLQNSEKLCSFVKLITMNKACKNHKLLLVTDLAVIQKPMEKSFWVFVEMLTSGLAYKNMSLLQQSVSFYLYCFKTKKCYSIFPVIRIN